MALSIREQIIRAVQTRLTGAIGVTCLRVPRIQRDFEGDALLGLIDEEDVPERIEYGAVRRLMQISVQYIAAIDQDAQNESEVANAMMAAVEAAVTATDRTLGGLALDIRYAAGAPAYDANVPAHWAAVGVAFEVLYQTEIGDPTTAVPE